uniref:2S albumin seed storage protein-like n=1 Tax=Erigeron canadensis TaxID=72917 RepID=UPI001CB8ECB1|nr:2S albumin seed storage protein-like [Erigeron canadensis]
MRTTHTIIIAILLLFVSIAVFVKASTQVNCSEQIKKQPMQYCHMFLARYEAVSGASIITKQQQEQPKQQDSLLQRCCQQLGKLDTGCRCLEIRDFVRLQQRGGWDAPRMKRLLQEAPNLPKTCLLGTELCHI